MKKTKDHLRKGVTRLSGFHMCSYLYFIALVFALVFTQPSLAQKPTITNFTPMSGGVGTTVTITGADFDPATTNNKVFFGGVAATVNAASTTELSVVVPHGATYEKASVLVNNLITETNAPYVVTFEGNEAIDANTFLSVQTEAALSGAEYSVLGDMDGDGLLDVITTFNSSAQIAVYPNTSTAPGAISLGTASQFTVHQNIQEIVLGDFDGDGKLDIATCNVGDNTNQAKVSILKNTSSGAGNISFANPIDYDMGFSSGLQGLASGDLDGDGKLDLAIAYTTLDRVRVFKNQSSGPGVIDFLQQLDLAMGSSPRSVQITDMDGDDAPDIVVVDQTPNASVLRNTSSPGSFSFEAKVDFALATTVNHVATGDVDGDGLQDIIASHASAQLSVFRNTSTTGSLSMATRQDYATISNRTSLADINGDGQVEMISFSAADVHVYKNTSVAGAISHDAPHVYGTGGFGVSSVAVGDMNNDGEPDLVVPYSGFFSSGIGIFKNARSENDLLSFSFPEQTGAATVDATNHTIDIEVATGTDVTNLVATFSASTSASSVKIGSTTQSNGVTANDFTNPLVYKVTAEDALTQDWTITVSVAASCTPDNVVANETTCDTYDFDGASLTASGTYNATLVNQAGCDSLVTLNLTILGTHDEKIDVLTYPSYDFNGSTLTSSGSYQGTFTNQAGCDSLVTLNLIIANPGDIAYQELSTSLTPVYSSSSAFGDVDDDGDQDVIITGSSTGSAYVTELYLNDGKGGFVLSSGQPFVGVSGLPQSVQFGDLDADNDLDVFVSGANASGKETSIYWNDGSGNFTLNSSSALRDLSASGVVLGDFTGDDVIDIFYSGNDGSDNYAELYENDGTGAFSLKTSFTVSGSSTADAADLNNDGHLDIILNFTDASAADLTEVYFGNGDGTFSTATQSFFDAYHSVVRLADINGDGYEDIFISGAETYNASSIRTAIYLNDGSGGFTETTSHGIPTVIIGDARFDDLDLDGDMDVIMIGYDDSFSSVTYLYENDGAGNFSAVSSFATTNLYNGNISTADINGDHFPELLLTGNSSGNRKTILYLNSNCEDEVEIEVNESESYDFNGNTLTASGTYQATFSNQYGCDSLVTLNLSILGETHYKNVYTTDASYVFGSNTLSVSGNYQETFTNQSGCDSLVHLNLNFDPDPATVSSHLWFKPTFPDGTPGLHTDLNPLTEGEMRIGDLDGDGDLDVVVNGAAVEDQTEFVRLSAAEVYLNDGQGILFRKEDAGLLGRARGDMELYDFDGDGDLDVFQVGLIGHNMGDAGTIELNDGTANFSKLETSGLPGRTWGATGAGDLDGDGDIDVVVSGYGNNLTKYCQIFLNNGQGEFTEDTRSALLPVTNGGISIGDLNGDNYVDIILTGLDASNTIQTIFYSNDGTGIFTEETGANLEAVNAPAVLLDVDGNETIDVMLKKKIFLNDGNGVFTLDASDPFSNYGAPNRTVVGDINADGILDVVFGKKAVTNVFLGDGKGGFSFSEALIGFKDGAGAIGDLTGDGYSELLFMGEIETDDRVDTEFYVNDGTGKFERNQLFVIDELSYGDAQFADLDGDGDQDLITTGNAIEAKSIYDDDEETTKLYFNDGSGNFTEGTTQPFTQMQGQLVLKDLDGDGDIDVLLSGYEYNSLSSDPVPYDGITEMYLNDGTASFTRVTGHGIPEDTSFGAMVSLDAENDGDLDLVLGSRLMINDGSGQFTESANHDFTGTSRTILSFGDVNNDGFPDLFRAGSTNSGEISRLYLNDGSGGLYHDASNSFRKVVGGTSEMVDMDLDGDLDLFISGWKNSSSSVHDRGYVYFNDGTGNFTEDQFNDIIVVGDADSKFSDLDGDGDPDLVVSGVTDANGESLTYVYLNNGRGHFRTYEYARLAGMRGSAVAITDVDGDGADDVFLSGYQRDTESRLYLNSECGDETRNLIVSTCDSYTFFGQEITQSGSYTHEGANGCGKTVTTHLDLTILSNSTTTDVEACESYEWEGTIYTVSGTYQEILTNSMGCDSTATLNLTLLEPTTGEEDVAACESYEWQGVTYTTSGTYQEILTNAAGCDSTATLNLIILEPTSGEGEVEACESYEWEGTIYTTSGAYSEILTNAVGCDSVATLTLIILESTSGDQIIQSCESYEWEGTLYETSGIYEKILTNANGCDSTAVLDLTILTADEVHETVTTCDSYEFDDQLLTTSGQYSAIFTNELGCDSLVSLELTILESKEVFVNVDACGSYPFGEQLITESGTYQEKFLSTEGCDSLVNLTVGMLEEPDAGIELNGRVLFATDNSSGLTYQWYDCDSGELLEGEDKRQLTPPRAGNYFVEVANTVCQVESICFEVAEEDILLNADRTFTDMRIYPNPSNGPIHLTWEQPRTIELTVIGLAGSVVQQETYDHKEEITLSIDAAGLYLIRIRDLETGMITDHKVQVR